MGMFDFLKGTGKKVFGNEAEIEKDNPGIKDLNVTFDKGVVSLSGTADSPEAMEKVVLMAGNVYGVSEVKADQLSAPPQTVAADFYIIGGGRQPLGHRQALLRQRQRLPAHL